MLVVELAPAVVPGAGVALGIFVGQHGAHRSHHGRAGVVLRGDQLKGVFLALLLGSDELPEFGILLGDLRAGACG